MMRSFTLICLLALTGAVAHTQDSYGTMTRTALETMWEYGGTDSAGFDTIGYRLALSRYQEAFAHFPNSIEWLGLYKASSLAGELGALDTAFMYLDSLLELNEGEHPGWNFAIGCCAESDYRNLIRDPRWQAVVKKAISQRAAFLGRLQGDLLAVKTFAPDTTLSGECLYQEIQGASPYLPKERRDYSVALPINDSTITSYFVHLPKDYEPSRKYPVLFFLHGAVYHNRLSEFQFAENNLGDWNRFYTQYADSNGVILVFPSANEEYNWMAPDAGFFVVPAAVRQLKRSLNIDDNKVFVSGHSNGATGSFSYLMKEPTLFAGFYGFNTYPKVHTGGTFPKNAHNRSFLNFSTDQDYYYPSAANDSLSALMHRLGVDYRDVRFNGFPHWFPEFDESEEAYRLLFADLASRARNPFPDQLSWEFDDDAYGAIDWLTDMRLDTFAPAADWQQSVNFPIEEWLEYDDRDSLIAVAANELAFDLPRKSGKVRAKYEDNVYRLETSRIGALTVRISPEMVDLGRPVKVYVNGELEYDQRVGYDKASMVNDFDDAWDRSRVWVNAIRIDL